MTGRSSTALRAASLMVASLALPGVLHGCSAPTAPAPPPGGGATLSLSFDAFVQSVEPVLVAQGCDAAGDCHGGGIRGSLELSPPGAKNTRFDFDQVVLQVSASAPDRSPILTEPLDLAAGGTPHPVKAFASTGDAGYDAIRSWIMAGVMQP